MTGSADNGHDIRYGQNRFVCSRMKAGPAFDMFFRPEEMDAASGEGPVFRPLAQGDTYVPANCRRISIQYDAISYHNPYRFIAIETGSLDMNFFIGKNPADRQGFEASLRIPFLLAVDRNAVLRREVIEWRK